MSQHVAKTTADICILTIRDDEFRALLAAFPDDHKVHRGRREYTLRSADAGDGKRYRLALCRQVEQGNGEAQDAARDLLDDFEPSLLLVVGIAAGLPSDDVTLGDVILSTRVNDYSVEARKAGAEPSYSLSGGPIAKKLATSIANLPAREDELGDWTSSLPKYPPVSWQKQMLYGPDAWKRELREKLQAHFGSEQVRQPLFAAGPIASSDRLVKDPTVLFPWIQTARHLLAIEMESGGVYRAARDRCSMLAIRSISDLVGLKRADAWTKYACKSAAAFAKAFLRTCPVPPKSSETARKTPRATADSFGDSNSEMLPQAPSAENNEVSPERLHALHANLLELTKFPPSLFIAPSSCTTYKQAFARLRENNGERVPRAWALFESNIYAFVDPRHTSLSKIVDVGAMERHDARDWAQSSDRDKRRLFVQLLNGALSDDLGTHGVWYFPKDDLYAFAGKTDEEPRKYTYQSVRRPSTMTVVGHYSSTSKDGRTFKHLRHLAFAGRFRNWDGRWYLQIEPTYRFTSDGRLKHPFHETKLAGIKRLESNRAVLSQLLVWQDVLTKNGAPKLLSLGNPPIFHIPLPIADDELTSIEEVSTTTDELPRSVTAKPKGSKRA